MGSNSIGLTWDVLPSLSVLNWDVLLDLYGHMASVARERIPVVRFKHIYFILFNF